MKGEAVKMLPRRSWHKSLTDDAIIEAAERRHTSLDDPGFCLICGCEAYGVEPDARNFVCESCGADTVFGIEELIIAIA